MDPALSGVTEVEIYVHLGVTQDPDKTVLSPDERARADRYLFRRDHDRYVVRRAWVRRILSGWCARAPEALHFSLGPQGKPAVTDSSHIEFNLSHSGDLAILAVAEHAPLGIDVEVDRPGIAASGIAELYFAPGEQRELEQLPASDRDAAFLECWTRKEAFIKAVGTGLSTPLDSFEVAFGPSRPAALVRSALGPEEHARWWMSDVQAALPPGYIGAIAIERETAGSTPTIRIRPLEEGDR